MLYRLLNTLRTPRRNGFVVLTGRTVMAIVLGLLLPAIASAYTIVMRDGRWVDIPDRFQVTDTRITYETTHGIFVTLQLTSIDIAATDKANGSPEGTLIARIGQGLGPEVLRKGQTATRRATRTLTNLDLEQTRLKRVESEAAYEVRRRELGLPSRDESDRLKQEEFVRLRELSARSEIESAESENYWRTRATELRNEIVVLDAEIDYVRARLIETGDLYTSGYFVTYGNPAPLGYVTGYRAAPPLGMSGRPIGVRQSSRPGAGTVGIQPRQQVFSNNSNSDRYLNQRPRFTSCLFGPCIPAFGAYPYNYNSYDRSGLIAKLQELEAMRVGFDARWQLLEDEARRAGAQPGWLRR